MTTFPEERVADGPVHDDYLPKMTIPDTFRHGRNVHDGYQRGWGLEFGGLDALVNQDPLFQQAVAAVDGRSVQDTYRQKNLFLLIKFYLRKIAPGCIIEFGSYRGGSAIFMAHLCRALSPQTQVYALDTFAGMPETDRAIDAHSGGDFANTDFEELQAYVSQLGLSNLHLVRGPFEATTPNLLATCGPVALAHIDCDIRSAVAYSYNVVKPAMCEGAYIVFDDATVSSCIGATEVVEQDVIARDGLRSEQIFPHFVFRHVGAEPIA